MLAEDLNRLKQELKAILPEEGISTVIKALKSHIPSDAPKFNALLQLESRLNEANLKRVKGVLSEEQLQLQYNKLRNDVLTFIDDLSPSDFSKEAAKKAKTGSVLYKVPREMELNKRSKCVVRLAYEESVIIQNIDLDKDTTLQSIRISETMEVAIIDPEGGTNFKITSISSPEQFLEDDDYSEWLFYVTPLTVGSHPIVLRISVIEVVGEKERKKEIVLEELVTIVTEPVEEDEELSFQKAGYSFAFSGIAPGEAAADAKGKSSGGASATFKKYSTVLGAFTVLIMASWAMGLFTFVSWQEVLWRDTLEGYESFMLDHPDSEYFPLAKQHLALRKAKNDKTENGLLDFIIDNPKSELVPEAVSEFKKRSKDDIKDRIRNRVKERTGKSKKDKPKDPKEKQEKEEVVDTSAELSLGIDTSLMDSYLDSIIDNVETEPEPEIDEVPEETPPQDTRESIDVPSGLGEAKPAPIEEDKEVVLINNLSSNMVFIEGGKFTMGCEEGDPNCDKTSKPAREVKVKDFHLSKHEVTQELWSTIMGYNPSYVKDCPKCPVEKVSYKEVKEFIKKLNRKTKRKYRLPSEAEWEFAARGGLLDTPSAFSGSDNFDEVAWHVDNCGKRPQPVGRKKPNELGLFDMTGNVQEWCEDNWHSSYNNDAPKNSKAWNNTEAEGYSPYRVYRGGGWNDDAEYSTVHYRDMSEEKFTSHLLGFRLASDK